MVRDWSELASDESISRTAAALKGHGITIILVNDRKEALAKLRELIPAGASVMTGSSTTLEQIGFVELLKSGQHPWRNLKDALLAEKDPARQARLRAESVLADYFLGSVHALSETGSVVTASASGSQLPAYAFTAPHVVWVAGTQKIVPTLEDAFRRIEEYVLPLEDARMKKAYGIGSGINKLLVVNKELQRGRLTLVLVKERLGF